VYDALTVKFTSLSLVSEVPIKLSTSSLVSNVSDTLVNTSATATDDSDIFSTSTATGCTATRYVTGSGGGTIPPICSITSPNAAYGCDEMNPFRMLMSPEVRFFCSCRFTLRVACVPTHAARASARKKQAWHRMYAGKPGYFIEPHCSFSIYRQGINSRPI